MSIPLKKTQKKLHDPIQSTSIATNQSNKLTAFLDDTISNAYKRPWHRLERGLRLNRLRQFVDNEKIRMQLSQVEAAELMLLLQKALDKKLLNSKTAIIYDMDTETILEIKGLVSHRNADGFLKFQFIEKKTGSNTPGNVTMKKRSNSIHAQPNTVDES